MVSPDDPDIQAALQGVRGAPVSGGSGLKPIGQVPTGFELKPDAIRAHRKVVRYFQGDERIPASLSSTQVAQIQTKLVQAGLLDADFRYGVWDQTSEAAYADLLDYANGAGLDKDDALIAYGTGQAAEIDPATGRPRARATGRGRTGQGRAPLTIRYANPTDVVSTANEVAQRRLGRKFRDDELQQFLRAYQGQEAQAQRQEYNVAETGGAFTAQPTVGAAAEAFAEQTDPDQAVARRLMDYTEGINRMLGGIIPGVEGR